MCKLEHIRSSIFGQRLLLILHHLFGQSFASLLPGLDTDSGKDDTHTNPLQLAELVLVHHHTQQHGEELSGHGDRDQGQASESLEGFKDRHLSDGTGERVGDDVSPHLWMFVRECERGEQLCLLSRCREEWEGQGEGERHEDGRDDVHHQHHLTSGYGFATESGEHFVLRTVGSSIEDEVEEAEKQTDQAAALWTFGFLSGFDGCKGHEEPNAQSHQSDHGILVHGELATVEQHIHDEHRYELARLGKRQCRVGDVAEAEESELRSGALKRGNGYVAREQRRDPSRTRWSNRVTIGRAAR